MQQVIVDTNFLLIPGQYQVDFISEIERLMSVPYDLCVLKGSLDEIEKLLKIMRGAEKRAAKLGFTIGRSLTLIEHEKGHVDDILVSMPDVIVCTRDKDLKKRLKDSGKKVITLSKSHLIWG